MDGADPQSSVAPAAPHLPVGSDDSTADGDRRQPIGQRAEPVREIDAVVGPAGADERADARDCEHDVDGVAASA